MTGYTPPEETRFDADGNPVEMGAKFYSPVNGILILQPGADKWVRGDKIPAPPEPEVVAPPPAHDPDAIPVADTDLTGWPLGRVSRQADSGS